MFWDIDEIYGGPLYKLEIKNVFLHGYFEEEIYIEQPPGVVAQGELGQVCGLKKSLYGLKIATSSLGLEFS